MKKAVLFIFVFLSGMAADSPVAAEKNKLLPGLYRVRGGQCPVLELQSFYCRGGGKISVRFTSETCYLRPRPDAVWYDGKEFYFAWLRGYKTEDPKEKEGRNLTTSIYWISQNECPNLTLKNVCNNKVIRSFRPSSNCYKDVNFFYWNGDTYRFGWVVLKRGIGEIGKK